MIWIQVRRNILQPLCYMNSSWSQGSYNVHNGMVSFQKVKQSLYFYRRFEMECRVEHHCRSKYIRVSNDKELSIVSPRMYFTEPQWLMPVRELDTGTVLPLLGDIRTCLSSDTEVIYRVQLITSMDANSSLSDPRASILLSIIGEHGRSIIHRISPLGNGDPDTLNTPIEDKESMVVNPLRFQRGCKDVITFSGPDLGILSAIWIAPMAGTWRLESATIIMSLFHCNVEVNGINSVEHETWDRNHRNLCYIFPDKDILIGDGACIPAAEMKPLLVHEISNSTIFKEFQLQNSVDKGKRNQEEGLKEYKALKMSLLFYNVVLVTSGTVMMIFLGMDDIAKSFSLGGLGSFLYLVFLQKTVDQLPGPGLTAESLNKSVSSSGHPFRNFQAPIARFASMAAVIFMASKLAIGTGTFPLSDKEFLAGAMGFIMCKVAVLLASYKPFPLNSKK